MSVTDPIADMLTMIRNASQARHEKTDIPGSKMKERIAAVLKRNGFIKNYRVIQDNKQGILRIYLRYGPGREEMINGLKRVSRPGLRQWVRADEIPQVVGGLGMAVLSTSQGIFTDRECRKMNVGGEVICYVW